MQGKQVDAPIHDSFIVPGATIRHGDWKLFVRSQKPGGGRSDRIGKTDRVAAVAGSLFDLKNDVGETTNIAADQPQKVRELTERMKTFVKELEANSRPVGTLSKETKLQ